MTTGRRHWLNCRRQASKASDAEMWKTPRDPETWKLPENKLNMSERWMCALQPSRLSCGCVLVSLTDCWLFYPSKSVPVVQYCTTVSNLFTQYYMLCLLHLCITIDPHVHTRVVCSSCRLYALSILSFIHLINWVSGITAQAIAIHLRKQVYVRIYIVHAVLLVLLVVVLCTSSIYAYYY